MSEKPKKREKTKRAKAKKSNKSRTTRAYRENELEVQKLLERSEIAYKEYTDTMGFERAEYEAKVQDEFFFGVSENCMPKTTVADKNKTMPQYNTHKVRSRKKQHFVELGDQTDESDIVDAASGVTMDYNVETTPGRTDGIAMESSTFIQFDFDVLYRWQPAQQHFYDEYMLYKPTAEPQLQLRLMDVLPTTYTSSTIRMMNRFIEEAKWAGEKLDSNLLNVFRMKRLVETADKPSILYRSDCNYQFRAVFMKPQREMMPLPVRSFLRLHFQRIRFTEHVKLLEEHRIEQHLEDMYEQYTHNVKTKISAKLFAALQTERAIVQQLMQQHETQEQRSLELEQHLLNVQELRQQYYTVEAKQKQLLKNILNQWAQLKLLRKEQQFQCTRFQLRLHVVQPQHIARAYQHWLERFEQDLRELYRERLENYLKEKRMWAKLRKKGVPHGAPMPKPPHKPQFHILSEELKTQYALSFYEPEEPRVEIVRIYADVTDTDGVGTRRHNQLKNYYLKVYFDQKIVGQTRNYRLEPDMHLYMNETMGVLLERHFPKQIEIVLCEKSKMAPHKKVAKIIVPAIAKTTEYKIKFDGSSMENAKTSNLIAGNLYLRLVYDVEEPKQTQPQVGYGDIRRVLNEKTSTAILPYSGIQKTSTSDNKNTSDRPKSKKSVIKQRNGTHTCTFQETLLQFCSNEELILNPRFRLLRSRYEQQNLRTKDLRFVPALVSEIAYEWEGRTEPVLDAGNWIDPIDMRRHRGKRYLRTLYEAVYNHCKRLDKVVESNEQLLVGDEPASWGALFRALKLIFNPRRPLQATAASGASSSRSCLQILLPDAVHNFSIVLNVVRASGIPVRSYQFTEYESLSQRNSDSSTGMFMHQTLVYSNVRPFVTLSYKKKLCRSSTAEGSNPTWNEQLVLPLSGCLNELREDIKIALFDECIEQHYADDSSDIYQRLQCNWLGEYRVPISSLITHKKFEGCFELNTPKVLIGYKRPTISSVTNISIDNYPEIKESVQLWCYLSIEPMYELPRVNTSNLECAELNEVRQHLQQFSTELRQLQPKRFVEPLVCTREGKRVCATRLLEAIPLAIESGEMVLDTACRFVSLQCILRNYDACTSYQGIWLDNQTLLDIGWCSPKDLGVLLCNYMLAIGIKCWLVLGDAPPYGETTYVLFRQADSGEYILVAPDTGKHYATRDVLCPLNSVRCIIEQHNIYYNIQREHRVSMTNFNLQDSSCWLPVFNKKNPAPIGGVQNLNYIHKVSLNFIQLRKNIEHKIMKKISAWRTTRKTIWNRAFQPRLLSILQQLESLAISALGTGNYEEPKFSEELEQEFTNFRIYGFTLNFPYTNLAAISERIRTTGIHLNSDKYVQFCVAVYIHPYPNNVLSIWIFLITVTPI